MLPRWLRLGEGHKLRQAYALCLDPESPDARMVLADIALNGMAGYTATYVPGDTHQTAFNEGKRFMANYILETVQLTPADVENIIRTFEQDERRIEHSRRTGSNANGYDPNAEGYDALAV